MWKWQVNPGFRGFPKTTQWAPPCVGREGAKGQEGALLGVLPAPGPTHPRAAPTPQPSRAPPSLGQH